MYCGVALPGSRGGVLSLLFFCRRFLFQIKRKCRNAGSIYRLIMVCSEGRNQLATIQPSYNFVSASPISDSRKGCPYEVSGLKFVRILKGERSSPLRSAKRAFPKISCRSRGNGALSRRTLQVAPNRLQISIHQPVLPYYAALYMQKSRQTLLPGLMLFYKVY